MSRDDSDIEFIEERPVRPKREPLDDIIDLAMVSTISCFRHAPSLTADDRMMNKHLISLSSTSLCYSRSAENLFLSFIVSFLLPFSWILGTGIQHAIVSEGLWKFRRHRLYIHQMALSKHLHIFRTGIQHVNVLKIHRIFRSSTNSKSVDVKICFCIELFFMKFLQYPCILTASFVPCKYEYRPTTTYSTDYNPNNLLDLIRIPVHQLNLRLMT
jgi:hypothetical protein